ncbi:MAG: Uma2 family endonuclease, partial [Nostoc sp.]
MIQALRKLVTFDEFVAQYPDNPQRHYELHDGVIVEMAQPVGDHEEVVGFLATKITLEYSRLNHTNIIPKTL